MSFLGDSGMRLLLEGAYATYPHYNGYWRDGRAVALVREGGAGFEVIGVDLDGANQVVLLELDAADGAPWIDIALDAETMVVSWQNQLVVKELRVRGAGLALRDQPRRQVGRRRHKRTRRRPRSRLAGRRSPELDRCHRHRNRRTLPPRHHQPRIPPVPPSPLRNPRRPISRLQPHRTHPPRRQHHPPRRHHRPAPHLLTQGLRSAGGQPSVRVHPNRCRCTRNSGSCD